MYLIVLKREKKGYLVLILELGFRVSEMPDSLSLDGLYLTLSLSLFDLHRWPLNIFKPSTSNTVPLLSRLSVSFFH